MDTNFFDKTTNTTKNKQLQIYKHLKLIPILEILNETQIHKDTYTTNNSERHEKLLNFADKLS